MAVCSSTIQSFRHSRMPSMVRSLLMLVLCASTACAQSDDAREWIDSTGTHKIVASLIEVNDGVAFLKSKDGKTLKIPLTRLSQADQEFLKGGNNPFEEVNTDANMSNSAPASSSTPAGLWAANPQIDWLNVEDLDRSIDSEWQLDLPETGEFTTSSKRAMLTKKSNFHEDIRRLRVNPLAQRAVVGFTVSFSVPKPLSRLSLIDLTSGKAIHTAPVECDMCPLTLLNDGSTVLMQGTSDERKGFETEDQLQLWKVNGKQVVRSPIWIPFPDEAEHFGKKSNAHIIDAIPLPNNKLILLGSNGHLACIDVVTRKPYWHTRLSKSFAVEASVDRSLLAIVDGHSVLIVDPQLGQVKCGQFLADKPHVAWPKVCWSPSGKNLLLSFTNSLRVLDLTKGEWRQECTFTGAPIATRGLDYPHEDYALLDGHLLLHIPSQIKVCDYRDSTRITTLGGTSFIGMQNGDTGFVVPAKIPHPAAEKILAQAKDDPSVFLIHPGVEVSVNASGAGQYASEVASSLEAAASAAGYKVVSNSPISIVASITGPKQEAVSYIASGSYIANVFQSSLRLTWQGKDVWSTGGNNIPGFIQTNRDQTIQDKLNELGKKPNLYVFEKAQFPKLLQRPSADTQNPTQSEALLVSKFTMQGLVDSK
jgi:hypothetical protein